MEALSAWLPKTCVKMSWTPIYHDYYKWNVFNVGILHFSTAQAIHIFGRLQMGPKGRGGQSEFTATLSLSSSTWKGER